MKSLKLNKINKNQLNAKQMKSITGGDHTCKCSCKASAGDVCDNACAAVNNNSDTLALQ